MFTKGWIICRKSCSARIVSLLSCFDERLDIEVIDLSDTDVQIPDEKLEDSILANKYKVIDKIGKGGMGQVVKAEDLMLHRPVAIKKLDKKFFKDKDTLERFKKEARLPD